MTEESIESRAAAMGHVPREEFRGNPDNWVDAETFVRMAEEKVPLLKGTLKVLEKKVVDQNATILAMREDLSEFVKFSKDSEERAYNRALEELRQEQQVAKESGDLPRFVEATEAIDKKISEHPTLAGKKKEDQTGDPYQQWLKAEPNAFKEWRAENSWYESEPDMFAYAQQMDAFLHEKHGFTVSRSERLKELSKLMKKKFPDYFGNNARKVGSPVEGDTGGFSAGASGSRSYNDLPPEAKKQCDKWAGKSGKGEDGTMPGFTREMYLKNYKW